MFVFLLYVEFWILIFINVSIFYIVFVIYGVSMDFLQCIILTNPYGLLNGTIKRQAVP